MKINLCENSHIAKMQKGENIYGILFIYIED